MLLRLLAVGMLAACGLTDEAPLPPDVQDPKTAQTPAGAVERYRGTLDLFARIFEPLLTLTGILTDELAALPAPIGTASDTVGGVLVGGSPYAGVDSRKDLTAFAATYAQLHRLRGEAQEARGFLRAFAPVSDSVLVGHLYAVEGYAELFLADLFCSGIPLTRVEFGADYTLAAGSRTDEVYVNALALFDSALALTGDSVWIQHLAAIGRGRALLALGRFAEAAAAVAAVPDSYSYQMITSTRLFPVIVDRYPTVLGSPSVADREGINGLDYLSSSDPRTAAMAQPGTDPLGHTLHTPSKYSMDKESPVVMTLADAVEARLIEAEAALRAGDPAWLAILNHLRQTVWAAIVPVPSGPLPALPDPGPDSQGGDGLRVDLVFRERAFWLYLTAHRQGDLRRLVRQYGRPVEIVFPMGGHLGGDGTYRPEVVPPVPSAEQDHNPLYSGCFDRRP